MANEKPKPQRLEDVEISADEWSRFERATDVLLHAKPKPRAKEPKSVVEEAGKD